ncbi:MAG: NTP transferase domain-containing protein [Thermoanaerobaculaceae bacterium]|jgi:bifunctional UDP-N-acetylglucosamine pyrophosphorylase/glucosamine-1-phosphate N-acetyltransferase
MSLSAVILAAGEGKRLKTGRAKVLHEAGGRPLLDHVLAAVEPLWPDRTVVVVGHLGDQVEAHLAGHGAAFAVQDPPRGTGDAVAKALPFLPEAGEVLVLSGDVPLITTGTLAALVELRRSKGAAAALVTAMPAGAGAYGRIVRNGAGDVTGIVEVKDANVEQRAIREVNAGTYAFDLAELRPALAELRPDNVQGEYYLTDAIGRFVAGGLGVAGLALTDAAEMAGVNSRADLAEVHRLLNDRVIRSLQDVGVTVLDPATTWIEADCSVGRDTVLEPGVHLRRACRLGERCRIGAGTVLEGVALEAGASIPPLTFRRAG